MTKPISLHAQRALERLQESWAVNQFIHSDAARNDAHCPDPNNPNAKYNASREYYLGSLQVCHAADTLNSYCQSILGEIFKVDSTAWTNFDATIKPDKKISREVTIAGLLSHGTSGPREGAVRTHLRDAIKCYWPFESEIIVKLRNKFVHQSGYDPKRTVEALIVSKKIPWCVICVDAKQGADQVRYIDSEWLDADVKLGQWACAHIRTHLDMMDQNLCHSFKVPTDRWRPRPISRQIGSLPAPRQTAFIQPNISATPAAVIDKPQENTKPPRRLIARSSKEETECELAWHGLKDAIFEFIKKYAKEAGVSAKRTHGGGVGNMAYSVRGCEFFLEYDMIPSSPDAFSKEERVCIRLRERNLVPFVTVWSGKFPMRDFITSVMNSDLEGHLRDVIDKVITH
jgi:hypothetical protein